MLISWKRPSTSSARAELEKSGRSAARRAGLGQHSRAVGPAFAMLGDEIREKPAVLGTSVQRRHVNELLAAGCEELRAVLHLDFFHRLEAVDREAGAHDGDFIDAARGQARHEIDGVRL